MDESAGALPGVTIVVRNVETGVSRETVTNTRGRFEVPGLQPGRYQVEAELTGFSRYSQGPVTVQVNEEALVNINLKVGQLSETINVVAQSSIVQTTTATLGKVIEEKQILELPLSGRNFTALGLLTPGVTTRGQSTSDAAYVVHGQRTDSNNFQLDGVANVSLGNNTVQARPNVDAVQEFKIQTSNFSAEFGRNSGSVVQVVTKSGTNSFRGSVWEFLRDDKFQAKNFFATTSEPPPLQQNQFGGTFGGPVTIPGLYSGLNRTFFFGAYEGFRLTRGLTRQAVVATAAERAGNLSFLSRPILDPATGLPFPGNVIPDNRISPAARQLLTLMPLPNIAGAAPRQNNFVSSPSQEQTFNQYMLRLDHTFNQKWSVFYRHFLQDNTDFNPFQGSGPAGYLGFPNDSHSRTQHATFAVNTALSSSLLNELRVGRSSNSSVSLNLPLLNPKDFGINYDRNQETAGGLGLPDITINGLSGIGNTIQGPTTNPANEWQISNVLSKSAGRHLLKVGGEFRRGVDDFDLGFFFVGRFVFNGTYTGDSFADFLLGRAVEFNHAKGRTKLAMRNQNVGAFFQDDIKLLDNLTVNLGRALRLLQPDHRRARPDVHLRRPAARQRHAAKRRRRGDHRRDQRVARELDLFPRQEQRPAQDRICVGHLRRRPPGAARRRRRVSQPAAQQPGAAAHPVLPVPGAAGLPRHDAGESDQARRGQSDHRPAVFNRPGHRDALHGRLQCRNAVAVRQEHGGRGGVRAERRQGPPAVRGNEPAVLHRRPDDRAQQGSVPARIGVSAPCCDRPTGAIPTTRGSR